MGAPLAGTRIAVTRPRAQSEDLARPLREMGAEIVIAPLIRIAGQLDSDAVRAAVARVADHQWVVFSSANGVDMFVAALREQGRDVGALAAARIACVGPATAAAAARHGIQTDAMPSEFIGDAIADSLAPGADLHGTRILLARAHAARDVLPQRLRERGAMVTDIELYRSEADPDGAQLLRRQLASDALDVITFTSGSAVRYFARAVADVGRALVAVIGPATAEAAGEAGLRVSIEAEPHTTEGLVLAIVRHFAGVDR